MWCAGRDVQGKLWEGSKCGASSHPLSVESEMALPLPGYDMIIPTGKLAWAFGCQSFSWGSITFFPWGWSLVSSSFWRFELIPLVSSSFRGHNWCNVSQSPIVTHTARLSGGQSSQANKETPLRQDIPGSQWSSTSLKMCCCLQVKSYTVHAQKLFCWVGIWCHHIGLAPRIWAW